MKHARFEAYQGKDGQWHVRVRASNGRLVGPTEGYTGGPSKALRAIETMRRAVADASSYPVAISRHGEQLELWRQR